MCQYGLEWDCIVINTGVDVAIVVSRDRQYMRDASLKLEAMEFDLNEVKEIFYRYENGSVWIFVWIRLDRVNDVDSLLRDKAGTVIWFVVREEAVVASGRATVLKVIFIRHESTGVALAVAADWTDLVNKVVHSKVPFYGS